MKLRTIFLTVMLMVANVIGGEAPSISIFSGNHIIMNMAK